MRRQRPCPRKKHGFQRKRAMANRYLEKPSPVVFFCILLACMVGLVVFAKTTYDAAIEQCDVLLENETRTIGTAVADKLDIAYELRAIVLGANGEDVDMSALGPLIVHDPQIRNVLIAPGGVVSQVYPLQGNEQVLGLNLYSSANASNEEALEATSDDSIVFTRPYELVQKGMAVSGRLSVYLPQEDGSQRYWGLVSVTLDFPQAMETPGNSELKQHGYAYRISQVSDGSDDLELINSGFDDSHQYRSAYFNIQQMQLRIDAYPNNGWLDAKKILEAILVSVLLAIIASYIAKHVWNRWVSMRHRAETDSLTGLLNRKSAEARISAYLHDSARPQGVFIILDLDYFKIVNDVLGHQAGDALLLEISHMLKNLCRYDDVVCRLGGDEFLVFLPCDDAQKTADLRVARFQQELQGVEGTGEKSVSWSCCIGVALAPENGTTFEELYKNADRALYHSKEQGRSSSSFYREKGTL